MSALKSVMIEEWFVALLDDLDKELNNYVMRCREWYSWHFPELGKVLQDHIAFAKVVRFIGELQMCEGWTITMRMLQAHDRQ